MRRLLWQEKSDHSRSVSVRKLKDDSARGELVRPLTAVPAVLTARMQRARYADLEDELFGDGGGAPAEQAPAPAPRRIKDDGSRNDLVRPALPLDGADSACRGHTTRTSRASCSTTRPSALAKQRRLLPTRYGAQATRAVVPHSVRSLWRRSRNSHHRCPRVSLLRLPQHPHRRRSRRLCLRFHRRRRHRHQSLLARLAMSRLCWRPRS